MKKITTAKRANFFWPKGLPKNITSTLEKQILRQRVASGYLFYGPGKKLKAALVLAKILLCQGKSKPCSGNCCRLVEKNIHPDFLVVQREAGDKQIKISAIREIIKKAVLKAEQRRVILIRKAELLGLDAANALLKTLEEPASKTIFLLTSSNFENVLPTIKSRCQGFYLPSNSFDCRISGREEQIKDFLEGDLIVRFNLAKIVASNNQKGLNFLQGLAHQIRLEMLQERDEDRCKKNAWELGRIEYFRHLLKINISAKLLIEDLGLELAQRQKR